MDALMKKRIIDNAARPILLNEGNYFSYRIIDGKIYIEQTDWVISDDDIDAALRYRSDSGMQKYAESYSYILAIIRSVNF